MYKGNYSCAGLCIFELAVILFLSFILNKQYLLNNNSTATPPPPQRQQLYSHATTTTMPTTQQPRHPHHSAINIATPSRLPQQQRQDAVVADTPRHRGHIPPSVYKQPSKRLIFISGSKRALPWKKPANRNGRVQISREDG